MTLAYDKDDYRQGHQLENKQWTRPQFCVQVGHRRCLKGSGPQSMEARPRADTEGPHWGKPGHGVGLGKVSGQEVEGTGLLISASLLMQVCELG